MFIDQEKIIEGNESEAVAHLAYVRDRASEALLCDILKDNGISYMIKERSHGLGASVIMGFSVFGSDIYVQREKLELARELYMAYMSCDCKVEENTEND